MRVAVVGAGPVGLVLAHALAGRGWDVSLVDPDPGPPAEGTWRRQGVMQFFHPHFFRHHVPQALQRHAPATWDAVVAAGGVVNPPPDGLPPQAATLSCRRETFEAALRASLDPFVSLVLGRASDVLPGEGVVVDGQLVPADLVLVAAGRTSTLGDQWRPPVEGGPCGQSYVSRMYAARPGVEPLTSWRPLGETYDGYLAIAFPQDAGTLSALVVRHAVDKGWEPLWREDGWDKAAAQIPALAPWTDPARFVPTTPVMRGGTLTNTYRGQGSVPPGVVFVGDTVCTTNPSAGRGVTLGLWQASALLDLLAEGSEVSAAFDAWCEREVRPWFDDHVRNDAYEIMGDLDVKAPLPSGVVIAAAAEDPSLLPSAAGYLGMMAPPSVLSELEPLVRERLRAGWRPAYAEGPSRDALLASL